LGHLDRSAVDFKRLVEIAAETGADAVAAWCERAGHDQVRFELAAYALKP